MTTQTFTIPARLIRAAQNCTAKKGDTREHLTGVLLSADGHVAGTNGHLLFHAPTYAIEKPHADIIVDIASKVPARAEILTFNVTAGDASGVCTSDRGDVMGYRVLPGTFPRLDRVIPTLPRSEHATGVGMDAGYLAKIAAVFGSNAAVALFPGGAKDAVLITSISIPGAVMVIMPRDVYGVTFYPLHA